MKRYSVSAVVLVVLMTAAFTGVASAEQSVNAGGSNGGHNGDRPDDPGSFGLNQSIAFGEKVVYNDGDWGIFMDGTLMSVDSDYVNPDYLDEVHAMYSKDVTVTADWSDNLVLHEWRVGDKVRTEVILKDVDDPSVSVYTICASFKIELLGADGPETVWYGTTEAGLWNDGPVDAYSAEVNQLGLLLYGYNWDTKGLPAGNYRLTFELLPAPIATIPSEIEADYAGVPISYNTVTIDGMVDPGMYGDADNYSLLGYAYTPTTTSIDIVLR